MKNKKLMTIAVVVLVLSNMATYFLTANGVLSGGKNVTISTNSSTVTSGVEKLVELEKKIQSDYYKDVDEQALVDGAIKGMFDAIGDEYSAYYTEEEYQKLMETTTGTYEGIGVVVTEDDSKTAVVVTPYRNTPAGNAGVQTNDRIVTVDGDDVVGKGMEYAVSKMRGEAGTSVKITVERDGTQVDYDLKRQSIDTQTVESTVLDDNVGYILISEFTENTADDFNTQLTDLQSKGIKGLIIDLRYNGGGLVDSSVAIADRLLGETEVVYTVDKKGNRQDYKSTGEVKLDLPMAILVNEGTASASEILSGAVQDTQAGTLVGTQTFGKGIVQEVISLMDGSGFKLTNAEYFTPNGRNIHGSGLTPDEVVEQTEEYKDTLNVPQDQDAQLQKALEVIKGHIK